MSTATPTDWTQLPAGPDRVELDAPHLRISGVYDSGSVHTIHLKENGDLTVILDRGNQLEAAQVVPSRGVETGHVIIALGVDGEHDEVNYKCTAGIDRVSTRELLSQAIEALVACRDAARKVGQE